MSGDYVWFNGRIVPAAEAALSVQDRGFLLGEGVFETIRLRAGIPLRLDAHLARLKGGCDAIGIDAPQPDWYGAIDALQAASPALAAEGVLRITVSGGAGGRGLVPGDPALPTCLIAISPVPDRAQGVRLCISKNVQRHAAALSSRWKTLSYIDQIAARREAKSRGLDDALLLNTAGDLCCASAANAFILAEGRWCTPAVSDAALPGTARGCLINELRIEPGPVSPSVLGWAEAIVLTNALGAVGVSQVPQNPHLARASARAAQDFNEILGLS